MSSSLFGKVWGETEPKYSGILAQTLVLSRRFRRLFLQKLSEKVDFSIRASLVAAQECEPIVETEWPLGTTTPGRMDIFVNFDNVLALGIENKKAAPLQINQLTRYQKYLRSQYSQNLLVFLAPRAYPLTAEERSKLNRERFISLDYKQLIDWADEYLRQPDLTNFKQLYFNAFRDFIGELEMKPFSTEELSALLQHEMYQSARKKAEQVVAKLGTPEKPDWAGFALTSRGKAPFPLYIGIRYACSAKWYFHEPLMDGQPELIAYVKDCEKDSEKAELVNVQLEQASKRLGYVKSLGAKLEYFPRRKAEECRLAIRRSLGAFVGKDPADISAWLDQAANQLGQVLTTVKP
jgi:hypothetical protein